TVLSWGSSRMSCKKASRRFMASPPRSDRCKFVSLVRRRRKRACLAACEWEWRSVVGQVSNLPRKTGKLETCPTTYRKPLETRCSVVSPLAVEALMKFSYSSGQRPLDGFTLKRGIGRGGFGEVYLAVSDGGKEVALKLLRDNSEVELRGVAQCL